MRSRPDGQKIALTAFFKSTLFYSLQRGSNGFISEKSILSKDSEGVQNFLGVSNLSTGGSKCLFL